MACQSSSFMRMSRLSRVMPALLTRIETAPNSLVIESISASTAPGSLTSSLRPWPPLPARRSPMACAPLSLVAVPMTVAPRAASSSAMAAPMPRLAPVTRAISPLRGRLLMSTPGSYSVGAAPRRRGGQRQSASAASKSAAAPMARARRRSGRVGQRGVGVRGCAEGARVQRLVGALGQAGQHLAGPALGDVGGATTGQGLDATGPAYRQVELAHQRVADRLDAVVD